MWLDIAQCSHFQQILIAHNACDTLRTHHDFLNFDFCHCATGQHCSRESAYRQSRQSRETGLSLQANNQPAGCTHLPVRCCWQRFDVTNTAPHEVTYICMTHMNTLYTSVVASLRLIYLYTADRHTALARHCWLQLPYNRQARMDMGHWTMTCRKIQTCLHYKVFFVTPLSLASKFGLTAHHFSCSHKRGSTGTKLHSKHSLSRLAVGERMLWNCLSSHEEAETLKILTKVTYNSTTQHCWQFCNKACLRLPVLSNVHPWDVLRHTLNALTPSSVTGSSQKEGM